MIERRRTPRNRTLLGGEVTYHPQYSAFRCVVRDLSDAGAQLRFSPSMVIPAQIDVTIAPRLGTRRAQVVWRRGEAVGVAFVKADAPISLDLARRLRDSEAEVQTLRRRLTALSDPA